MSSHLLVIEEELEVLELAASVGDLIGVAVESLTVLVLRASLVVREHANAILHSENLVVNTAIVTILVAQIVKPLAKLSDKLIFLGRANLHATCLHSKKVTKLVIMLQRIWRVRRSQICLCRLICHCVSSLLTLFDIV